MTLPLYQTIALDLKQKLISKKQFKLPSERLLAKTYCVSRTTIRRAIQLLQLEQNIISLHGSGHFVKAQPTLLNINQLIYYPSPFVSLIHQQMKQDCVESVLTFSKKDLICLQLITHSLCQFDFNPITMSYFQTFIHDQDTCIKSTQTSIQHVYVPSTYRYLFSSLNRPCFVSIKMTYLFEHGQWMTIESIFNHQTVISMS